jgi:hypothetical protein
MKTLGVVISAAALSLAFTGSAGAVDLWETTYGDGFMENANITITENGQERHLVLMNGDLLHNICSSACTIAVEGGKTVQASAADVVEVRGTSISVRHSSGAYAQSPQATQQAMLRSPAKSNSMTSEEIDAISGGQKNDALADPFDGPEGGSD